MGNEYFLNAEDVKNILGCSEPHAYKIIRNLNKEIKEKGYMTMSGRVEKNYLLRRYGIDGGINEGTTIN